MSDSKSVANVVFSLDSDHLSPRMMRAMVNFSNGESSHFATDALSDMPYRYPINAIIGDIVHHVGDIGWLADKDGLIGGIIYHIRSGNDVKVNPLGICGAWAHRDQSVTEDVAPEPSRIVPAIASLRSPRCDSARLVIPLTVMW